MRLHWLALVALTLIGCGLPHGPLPVGGPPLATGKLPDAPGDKWARWDPSVSSIPLVPALDESEPDTLTLVAECLERGDCAKAAIHLEAYLCRHTDQLLFRAQLAELLIRAGRDDTAKAHYERFIAEAQTTTGPLCDHLVAAHTRLMEIAQRNDDHFAELFHRGAGLLLLVKQHEKSADADAGFGEEMLCKAMKALAEAKKLNPNDARARVYLAEAYERSGNRRAACAERAGTRLVATPGQLTNRERQKCLLMDESCR
jgi:tetratricopeptide (TPR) repeat protein